MPDIFVPLDTSMNSNYYFDLLRKNVFNDFTLTYVDNNRTNLKKEFPNIEAFRKNYLLDDKLFNEFVALGEKQGVKKDAAGLATSSKLIRVELKALIARNLWDTDAFFEVVNEINPFVDKAVEAIQSNTFEKLKIAER